MKFLKYPKIKNRKGGIVVEDILSISELFSPGNTVQIEFISNAGTKIVSKTVVHNLNENQLSLSIPRWDDAISDQSRGNPVVLVCKLPNKQHDYVFTTKFINFKLMPPLLTVNKPSLSNYWKGRRFFRSDVNQVLISYFNHNREYQNNEVVNLSSSGLYSLLDYRHDFEPGMEVTCRIFLPTMPNPFLFVGKVVRVQKHPEKQGVAFQFQYPSPVLQNQITKFLYTSQLSLVRQGKLKLLA
jgi:c-di-GMP-binding flagellar brake protein YcgR